MKFRKPEQIYIKIIHQIWIEPNKKPDIWMNTWSVDYTNKHTGYGKILEKPNDLYT
jgi:hypothetical protein